MHTHLEVIMPPTDDIHAALSQILTPFDENCADEEARTRHAFWDYWKVGGRWSGNKLLDMLGRESVAEFSKILADQKVTVSGLQWGKPTLSPEDQAEKVNALWCGHFPDAPVRQCPLFDNYTGDFGDVLTVGDVTSSIKCSHVIIAGPNYEGNGIEAKYMVRDQIWNGVTHQDTTWDQTISSALSEWSKRLESYNSNYAAKNTPTAEWVVVTVDYHS
jgi:hypothetical protein